MDRKFLTRTIVILLLTGCFFGAASGHLESGLRRAGLGAIHAGNDHYLQDAFDEAIQGFLVLDYAARYEQARQRLAQWVRTGRIRQRFDIAEGLENTPAAFVRLLTSRNTGKQLVKVA